MAKSKPYESRRWMQLQHHTNKKSLKEIAQLCNVEERTIRRKMEKHGLRIINW